MSKRLRLRNYVVTIHLGEGVDCTEHGLISYYGATAFGYFWEPFSINWDLNGFRYAIFALEKCPDTGRLHWQGYVELRKAKDYKQVLTLVLGRYPRLNPRTVNQ